MATYGLLASEKPINSGQSQIELEFNIKPRTFFIQKLLQQFNDKMLNYGYIAWLLDALNHFYYAKVVIRFIFDKITIICT